MLTPPGTAEDGGDLFQQHRHGEGLGHIVVDLQVKAPKLLRLPVQGGEHEDGDLGFLADQLAHAEAVYFGQHDVQQDQVKGGGAEQLQGLHPVSGQAGLVASLLEIGGEQLLDVRLVFHDQDSVHFVHPNDRITGKYEFYMERDKKPEREGRGGKRAPAAGAEGSGGRGAGQGQSPYMGVER